MRNYFGGIIENLTELMADYTWLEYMKNGSIYGSFLDSQSGGQSHSQSRLNRVITP